MSCHFSCLACSGQTFLNLCLNCPTTRHLEGTSCVCDSGYYEHKLASCVSSSSIQTSQSTIISVISFTYYVSIGLFWISVFLNMNRIFNTKIKKLIDTSQILSLILYYRYSHSTIASKSLSVFEVYNFGYLNKLICTAQGPPQYCSSYQNLVGPVLMVILFFLAYFLTYFIIKCSNVKNLTFLLYIRKTFWGFSYLYFDYTIIGNTLSFVRIVLVSYFGFFLIGLLIFSLLFIIRKYYMIINNPHQTQLAYRVTNNYLYIYDENYHLNYIDFIYQNGVQENERRRESSKIHPMNNSTNNFQEKRKSYIEEIKYKTKKQKNSLETIGSRKYLNKPKQQQNQHKQQTSYSNYQSKQHKYFTPHSNFLIFQLLFKSSLATSVVLLYQFRPPIFAYLLVFALLVQLINHRVFFYYERSDLFIYLLLLGLYLFIISIYWISWFDTIIFITMLIIQSFILFFEFFNIVTGFIERKILLKMFQDPNAVQQTEEQSSQQEQEQNQGLPVIQDESSDETFSIAPNIFGNSNQVAKKSKFQNINAE